MVSCSAIVPTDHQSGIDICQHHIYVVVSGISIKFCRKTLFYRLIVRRSTLCELIKIKGDIYKCHIELQ